MVAVYPLVLLLRVRGDPWHVRNPDHRLSAAKSEINALSNQRLSSVAHLVEIGFRKQLRYTDVNSSLWIDSFVLFLFFSLGLERYVELPVFVLSISIPLTFDRLSFLLESISPSDTMNSLDVC